MDDSKRHNQLRSISDASRLLGIGRTTLYELLATGQLRAVKIGRRTFVSQHALDDFMAALSAYKPHRV